LNWGLISPNGMKNKRIVVYSSRLHRGGAEKHLVFLLNALSGLGWEVHLVLSQRGGSYEKMLGESVTIYSSSLTPRSYSMALLAGTTTLFKIIKKVQPSLLFSIQDGPNIISLLVSRFFNSFNIPVVIAVQNNPARELAKNPLLTVYFRLCRLLYGKASMLIALSEGVRKAYAQAIPDLNKISTRVSYNIGLVNEKPYKKRQPPQKVWNLLAVGRLTAQKDFNTLIEAMRLLKTSVDAAPSHASVALTILGDGELYSELKTCVQEKDLVREVMLAGFVEDVDVYYRSADVFILSSQWEGFGNVIVEAMAHGLPVIATDCEFGPAEIIQEPGVQGLLVPVGDANALAKSIMAVMNDANLYQTLSQKGRQRSLHFTASHIAMEYDNCFQLAMHGKN
jgi:glycosyltransferase involved in cell wall biosynthesis